MKRNMAVLTFIVFLTGVLAGCQPLQYGGTGSAAAPATAAEAEEAAPAETEAAAAEAPSAETSETVEAAEPAEDGSYLAFTDMMGHEVTLEKPAERVVALSAADCEILFAIGAGDLLVGRGEYCDYPAEVLDKPSVDSGSETNIEQILALEPDVLIMSSMAQTQEQVQALENAGVDVVVSDAQDIEGVYTSIRMIGMMTGHDAEAESVVQSMQDTFAELKEDPAISGQTIYFEVSPLEWGLWTAGEGTFMDEIASILGLTNVFHDVAGWGEISEEQVLERDPDHIVTISMYFGEGPTPEEEIMSRAGWENVKAVQNKSILNLQNNELSRPAPRLADGARMLYEFLTSGEAGSGE